MKNSHKDTKTQRFLFDFVPLCENKIIITGVTLHLCYIFTILQEYFTLTRTFLIILQVAERIHKRLCPWDRSRGEQFSGPVSVKA